MRNECNIVRDLLPLYAESMVSSDSAELVSEHLKGCEACRRELARAKEPQLPPEAPSTAAPLKRLRNRLNEKKWLAIALTAILLLALFVSAFAMLDAPIYLPYSESRVTVDELGDKGIFLTFDEEVTDFACTLSDSPDITGCYRCEIQAWTSLWDKWFGHGNGKQFATVTVQNPEPVMLIYVPNSGDSHVMFAAYEPEAEAGSRVYPVACYENAVALPRLWLGYCFLLAAAALVILAVVRILTRRHPEVCIWVERAGLYPIAYLISHIAISGIHWATYSLPRDLSLIVFLSILLYIGLLLVHSILQNRLSQCEI